MRCPRCRGDCWCVVGAEPKRTLAGQRLKEQKTSVWGAGHPSLVKVREPGERQGRAQRAPHTAAFQPHLQLGSPPPSPTPLGALFPGRGGGGTGNPPGRRVPTPRGCCGPRSRLPGAAVRGFEASERRARRGSSLPRRLLPIALRPDSVQGAEQPDRARLQPPLAPPPLPQTEDAPWRLEACVSSCARESGICSGALETPRLGARGRAHARLRV